MQIDDLEGERSLSSFTIHSDSVQTPPMTGEFFILDDYDLSRKEMQP